MQLVILEPLGVDKEAILELAEKTVGDRAEIIYYDNRVEDTETLIQRSREADIVVLSNFKYGREVIAECPNLKMICIAFTGVDHVDTVYCRERGITVCNCAGYSTQAVAELVFGMVLQIYRRIKECDMSVRNQGTKDGLVGFELAGKKFGIIGAGAIGRHTAAIAGAFGCQVLAYSRTVREIPGIRFVDLETLLQECDIVSLHVPATEETRNLIGKHQLNLMKKNAILINTARGPVLDSHALADALNSGQIAGAAVDVYEQEPPIPREHPLLGARNLVATPHVAFATKESMVKRAHIVFENIDMWLKGTPRNIIVQ